MIIRAYRPVDLNAVAQLFTVSIHNLAAGHYNQAQLDVWAPETPDLNLWRKRLADLQTLVAEEHDELAGFIAYSRGGHIELLYVSPAYPRRGVASVLYRHAQTALYSVGITALTTHASLSARPFFEHQGFTVEAEENVARLGVSLPRLAMRKSAPKSP